MPAYVYFSTSFLRIMKIKNVYFGKNKSQNVTLYLQKKLGVSVNKNPNQAPREFNRVIQVDRGHYSRIFYRIQFKSMTCKHDSYLRDFLVLSKQTLIDYFINCECQYTIYKIIDWSESGVRHAVCALLVLSQNQIGKIRPMLRKKRGDKILKSCKYRATRTTGKKSNIHSKQY